MGPLSHTFRSTIFIGITQVVRYTALFSGVAFGWYHRRSLQAAHDTHKLNDATHQREKLVAEAKQAWKRKQEASSDTTREHHSITCGSLSLEARTPAHAVPYDELANNILPSDNRSRESPLRPRETSDKLGKELINAFFIQYSSGNRLVLTPSYCLLKLAATLTLNLGSTPDSNCTHHGICREEHDYSFRAQSPQWLALMSVIEFIAIRTVRKARRVVHQNRLPNTNLSLNSILSTSCLFVSHISPTIVPFYLKGSS